MTKVTYICRSPKEKHLLTHFFSHLIYDLFYRFCLSILQQGGGGSAIQKIAEVFPQPPKQNTHSLTSLPFPPPHHHGALAPWSLEYYIWRGYCTRTSRGCKIKKNGDPCGGGVWVRGQKRTRVRNFFEFFKWRFIIPLTEKRPKT
jgi:hypothetical protein